MEWQSLDDSTTVYNVVYWLFKPNWWALLLRKKKRDSFQNITARRQCPWAPKSSDIDVHWDSRLHACSHSIHFVTHGFCKTIAAIDSDSSGGSGQRKLKIWKGHTILDTMKNICDSWEKVKISTLTGVQKKLIPTLTADFEEFKTQWRKLTTDVVEITSLFSTRELNLFSSKKTS